MRLVVSTPAVLRVLAITGVDRLINVYPTVAASLAEAPGNSALLADNTPEKAETAETSEG
jgi:hypothetical protein